MTDTNPAWSGLMNLDGDEPTVGPVGRLLSENGDAILFVWRHRGHLGRIRISAHSKESLNQRAKAQGTTALAEAIRAHIPSDAPGHGPMGPPAFGTASGLAAAVLRYRGGARRTSENSLDTP